MPNFDICKPGLLGVAALSAAAGLYAVYKLSQKPARPPPYSASSVAPKPDGKNDREVFMQVYEQIRADILYDKADHPRDVVKWIEEMIDYNIVGGKMTRGLTVIHAVRCLKPELLEDEEMCFRFCALGWCIEWLQATFLIADDIMDDSITRRGKPCWYKVEHVKMNAVNDILMLEALMFRVLRMYFKGLPYYADIMDLFHDLGYDTTAGELCDLITAPIGQVDLDRYSMEKYNHIVKYKTSLYTFCLPVIGAMMCCGITDAKRLESAREFCCLIGEFFQIQDDYLDCYGDPQVIGKVGTDIEDNKCSWLVCQALLIADEKQTAFLK
ncbi:hypothetical protein CYMTET_20264, partial [Cymbomonas tetramitiformis]